MFLVALLLTMPAAERDWSIEIVGKGEAIAVAPLAPAEVAAWKATPPKEPGTVLSLFVEKSDLAMFGEWKVEDRRLLFTPRFPLSPGVAYRVVLHPDRLPGFAQTRPEPITRTLQIPKPPRGPATFVEQVFPTADVLPENHLKFYLHFSAPMSQGQVYRRTHLLDAEGKVVESVFLELEEELWDRDLRRLTLYFHPGRIKRELKLREEEGPILIEGKSYTLEIDAAWKDAEGNPLRETFRKRFKAAAPDEKQPDPKTWKITAPKAGTRESVTVTLPESLDHALMQRLLWIEDAAGKPVAGKVTVGPRETTWLWTPTGAWAAGEYRLVADTRLEDLAGNTIGQPFEIDIFRPIQREIVAETVGVKFSVR